MEWKVTHLLPTFEVCSSNPEPFAGKLAVAYQCPSVYIIESLPTSMYWILKQTVVNNLYNVLKVKLNPCKINDRNDFSF